MLGPLVRIKFVWREGIDNDKKIEKVEKCDLIPNTWQLWV
jgi:hypothetical protein